MRPVLQPDYRPCAGNSGMQCSRGEWPSLAWPCPPLFRPAPRCAGRALCAGGHLLPALPAQGAQPAGAGAARLAAGAGRPAGLPLLTACHLHARPHPGALCCPTWCRKVGPTLQDFAWLEASVPRKIRERPVRPEVGGGPRFSVLPLPPIPPARLVVTKEGGNPKKCPIRRAFLLR